METKQVKSDVARRNFRGLLDEVEHHDVHVTITRWNVPVAVAVPAQWYEEAKAQLAAYGRADRLARESAKGQDQWTTN